MLATQAFDINTSLANAYQYIQHIILTPDGTNLTPTAIELNGTNGNAYFSWQVGIWTPTPSQALEVNGNVALTTGWRMWATNGQIYMAKNGNVGIGTYTPTEKFQVWSYAWIGADSTTDGSTTWWTFLRLYWSHLTVWFSHPKTTPNIQLNYEHGILGHGNPIYYNNWMIDNDQWTFSLDYATWTYNYQNKFAVLPNGAVGINTTTPNCGDATNPYCGLMVADRDTYLGSDVAMMNWDVGIWYNVLTGSSSAGDLYVSNNVGIGATTPYAKLEVVGWVKVGSGSAISHWSACTWQWWTIAYYNWTFYGCRVSGGSEKWFYLDWS